MKKISMLLCAILVSAFAFQGCEDIDDNAVPVNDFVWKGLNLYYLWQPDVPNLADDRFSNQGELNSFLESYSNPEDLFYSLLYQYKEVDRFSVIFPDFVQLENALQGVSTSTGMEYQLYERENNSVIGVVWYVLPSTDAEAKGVKRGDIFYAVNGTPLTTQNRSGLLGQPSFTINLADYNGGDITPNGEEITLTRSEYSENPVHTVKVFNEGAKTIGYLMYNGFYANYDEELNAAIGQLKSEGINELVLDLRYNGGGSVRTATYLASMITGEELEGELFAKEQWNPKLQSFYEANNPEALENRFTGQLSNGTAINHLGLSRVYVLATGNTASASELLINCLRPYMEVIVIGTTTVGKNVASVTLYDSPDFTRRNLNGSHRYAMQPIVLRVLNSQGFGDYSNGIAPSDGLEIEENFDNLGELGNPDEPYLATAISHITGAARPGRRSPDTNFRKFKDSKSMRRFGTEMYIEELPEGSLGLIKDLQ